MRRVPLLAIWLITASVGCAADSPTVTASSTLPTSSVKEVSSATEGPTTAEPAPSPSTDRGTTVVVGSEGVGNVRFGELWVNARHALVEVLGEPSGTTTVHGDMPMGHDGMDATARRIGFDGGFVVFGDWVSDYRDDGRMHLVAWDVIRPTSGNGNPLRTAEGISVGSSVDELREAFGSSLDLTVHEWCTGEPWYFVVESGSNQGLWITLSDSPERPQAKVIGLHFGAIREGVPAPC